MVAMVINVGIIKYKPLANWVRERMVMTDDQTASCDCQMPSLQEFRGACHTRSLKLPLQGYVYSVWYQERTEWCLVP